MAGVKGHEKAARRSSTLPHPGRSEEHLLKWLAIMERRRMLYNNPYSNADEHQRKN